MIRSYKKPSSEEHRALTNRSYIQGQHESNALHSNSYIVGGNLHEGQSIETSYRLLENSGHTHISKFGNRHTNLPRRRSNRQSISVNNDCSENGSNTNSTTVIRDLPLLLSEINKRGRHGRVLDYTSSQYASNGYSGFLENRNRSSKNSDRRNRRKRGVTQNETTTANNDVSNRLFAICSESPANKGLCYMISEDASRGQTHLRTEMEHIGPGTSFQGEDSAHSRIVVRISNTTTLDNNPSSNQTTLANPHTLDLAHTPQSLTSSRSTHSSPERQSTRKSSLTTSGSRCLLGQNPSIGNLQRVSSVVRMKKESLGTPQNVGKNVDYFKVVKNQLTRREKCGVGGKLGKVKDLKVDGKENLTPKRVSVLTGRSPVNIADRRFAVNKSDFGLGLGGGEIEDDSDDEDDSGVDPSPFFLRSMQPQYVENAVKKFKV